MTEWSRLLFSCPPHCAIENDTNSSVNKANEINSFSWLQQYVNKGQNGGSKENGR